MIIEGVAPEIDGGRFPIKRTVGEPVVVEADVFTDGHDALTCRLLWRAGGRSRSGARSPWHRRRCPNDRLARRSSPSRSPSWAAGSTRSRPGSTPSVLAARPREARRRRARTCVDLRIGAALVRAGERAGARRRPAGRCPGARRPGARTSAKGQDADERLRLALDDELRRADGAPTPTARFATTYDRGARRSWSTASGPASRAWYELFPRSPAAPESASSHGTFRDVRGAPAVRRGDGLRRPLPAADPPDRHDATARARTTPSTAEPGDVGQPVGDRRRGGRPQGDPPRARHARRLPRASSRQAARARPRARARHRVPVRRPTIPRSRSTPSGSATRPDGTIQYAENPPKKYQDIYPVRLRERRLARRCGTSCASVFASGSTQGVRDLPRRQPAHQAVRRSGSG